MIIRLLASKCQATSLTHSGDLMLGAPQAGARGMERFRLVKVGGGFIMRCILYPGFWRMG